MEQDLAEPAITGECLAGLEHFFVGFHANAEVDQARFDIVEPQVIVQRADIA